MAINVKTIGTGETHTTIASWESATDINLVAATDIEVGELKAENFDEIVSIAGATVNSSYYRCLLAQLTAEFDHTEITKSKARIDSSRTTNTTQFTMSEAYFRGGWNPSGDVRGFGVKVVTTTVSDTFVFDCASSTPYCVLKNIVAYECESNGDLQVFLFRNNTGSATVGCLGYNITVHSTSTPIIRVFFQIETALNCVIHGLHADQRASLRGFQEIANCYNCAGGDVEYGGMFGTPATFVSIAAGDYCVSDDEFAPGPNSQRNVTDTDCWASITVGSEDFHVKDIDSPLYNGGDDSYNVDFDIDGVIPDTRGDVGIDEYAAGSIYVFSDLWIGGYSDLATGSGNLFIIGPRQTVSSGDLFTSGSLTAPCSGDTTCFINGLEAKPALSCPVLDPTASIQIEDSLIRIYQSRIDALINQLGKNIYLEFDPIRDPCPNCEFDTRRGRSTNVYKIGGPRPFARGRKCPYCKGRGFTETAVNKCIKCLIKWSPKEVKNFGIAVTRRKGIVRLKAFLTDADDLRKAKTMLVNHDIVDRMKLRMRLIRGPTPAGLREDRYCISFWELL